MSRSSHAVSSSGTINAGGTTTADRVARILFAFGTGPALIGVSEMARELNLSKAVVYRIFQSLVGHGFLQADATTRAYQLGPSAVALGARALRDSDMRAAARPILESLRDETNETTTLTELVGDHRIYLDQFESSRMIRMSVELGQSHPLHAGSSGKSILAFMPTELRDRLVHATLQRITPATITDRDQLVRELDRIRADGFAVSLGERQHDAGSVAAPVFDRNGTVIGALSICGPVSRLDPPSVEQYSRLIVDAAAEVSRRMGWSRSRSGRAGGEGAQR